MPVAKFFRGKFPKAKIVICADDDAWREGNPGITHARAAAEATQSIVAIPEFGEGRQDWQTDFNDLHKQCGLNAVLSQIKEVLADTTAYHTLTPITLEKFLSLDLKSRTFVLSNLIHEGGIVMIYAWRGVGKTWFAVALGFAIASGGHYLKWKAENPRRVLHVCGEMPAVALRERIAVTVTGQECEAAPGYYRVLSSDLHEMGIPDLASPEGQAAFDQIIGDAEVILFDNASTLFRSGRENEAESWLLVQAWLLKLRRQGRTVIVIHHAGKGREQRGTSRREDVLDLVLNLRTPSDYDPVEGARFEIHFEKHRGLMGKDVDPFEAKLETRDDKTVWIMRDLEDAKLADIQELKELGRTCRQIATELGLSKSTVERALKKAKETG